MTLSELARPGYIPGPTREVSFDVERVGPTRVYPWASYAMRFKVTPSRDYKGNFYEYVPTSFLILDANGANINNSTSSREIRWSVDWKEGQTYFLDYIFDAPNVSPEFYLLGPAKVGEFAEKRQWQIAADAKVSTIHVSQINPIAHTFGNPAEELIRATSTLFQANSTYLIYISAGFTGTPNNVSVNYTINYGATTMFSGQVEPMNGTAGEANQQSWFDVYTQPASPNDITVDFSSVSGTTYGFNAQIFALNLDDLTASDWKYASNTSSFEHASNDGYVTVASTTLDIADGEKDWLIMGMEEVVVDTNTRDFRARVTDGSTNYMYHSMEGETTNEVQSFVLMFGQEDVATNTDFSLEVADQGNPPGDQNNHQKSRMFALNLDAFRTHKLYYSASSTNLNPDNAWVSIGNLNDSGTYKPAFDGDQFVFASFVDDCGSAAARTDYRLLVNSTSTPTDWTWEKSAPISILGRTYWDGRSIGANSVVGKENIPASGYTISLEARELGVSGLTQQADEVSLVAFSEYLRSNMNVSVTSQSKSDSTIIANQGWSNDQYMQFKASAVNLSSSYVDFYFEIASGTDPFTTGTSSISSACSNSMTYGSCGSKIWQASTTVIGWYDTNWHYRKKITINASQIVADQSDFPVLATATDASFAHTSFGGKMGSSTGADIVITDAFGTTTIPYERELYVPATGEIVLWIKTDISSTTNTDLYIYYGNAYVASDMSTTTGVWDANYMMVQHLEESSGSGNYILDSTANNNHGAPGGTTPTHISNAQVDGGWDFGGSNQQRVEFPDSATLRPTSALTASGWARADSWTTPDHNPVLWKGTQLGWGANYLFRIAVSNGAPTWGVTCGGTEGWFAGGAVSTGNWYHYVLTFDGTDSTAYINGTQVGTANSCSGQTLNGTAGSPVRSGFAYRSSGVEQTHWDGQVDELRVSNIARSPQWIQIEYANQRDVNSFLSFDVEEPLSDNTFIGTADVQNIPESSTGYKWRVIVLDDTGDYSSWRPFNTITPNFYIDLQDPSAPGPLEEDAKTKETITVGFGLQGSDMNFWQYRIYYKEAVPGVTTIDNLHTDDDLNYIDYAGTENTIITGLKGGTTYYLNIWIYDKAGNSTSSSEIAITTQEAGRVNSVQFLAGSYNATGTTGQLTDNNYTLPVFDFSLAEEGASIKNAYIIFDVHYEAYFNDAGNYTYNLAFDSCAEPCTPDAFNGVDRLLIDDNTLLAYNEGGSNFTRILMDVTSEVQLAAYSGNGADMAGQTGYRLEKGHATTSIAMAKAVMVITYTYENTSPSVTNTVVYPLESTQAGDQGTRSTSQSDECLLNYNCPKFAYNIVLPEYTSSPFATSASQWFETYNHNDNNRGDDIAVDVNIEGVDILSTTYYHEAGFNLNGQGNVPPVIFTNVVGYNRNASQILEYRASTSPTYNPIYYLLGGEVFETYTASNTASVKTKTVSFPLGPILNGTSTAVAEKSIDVYFPENGSSDNFVDIKKAWFRIKGNDRNRGIATSSVWTQVGDNATSSGISYYRSTARTSMNPMFNIFHIIPGADYTEMETANGVTPVPVKLIWQNSTSTRPYGISAELMITYTYSDSSNGYLTSLNLFGGQSYTSGSDNDATSGPIYTVFPEAGYKTLLSAALRTHSFLTGSLAGGQSYYLDANIGTTVPSTYNNQFLAVSDGVNTFIEWYKDVTSSLTTTNNQAYYTRFTNNRGGGGATDGAKPNAELIYTYQYYNPPPVNLTVGNQYRSDQFTTIPNQGWTNQNQVWLTSSAIDTTPTTNQIDFYFQLATTSGAFTSSTTAPGSSCSSGTTWAGCSVKIWNDSYSASSSSDWYDTNWHYRKKITINASQIVADQSDFPVLATATDASFAHTSFGGKMGSSTGADIVITDAFGTTTIPYERELYVPATGEIVLWIKTDISSTTNTDLYIYYGNAYVASDMSTTTGVWDANYMMVQHLEESSGSGNYILDSTANNNHGAPGGTTPTHISNAQVDGGWDFGGSNQQRVEFPDSATLRPTSALTASGWARADSWTTPDHNPVLWKGTQLGWGANYLFRIAVSNGAPTWGVTCGGTEGWFAGGAVSTGNWYHYVLTFDGTDSTAYINGTQVGTANSCSGQTLNGTAGSPVRSGFAYRSSGVEQTHWDGQVDELRVSNIARSPQWIQIEYANQRDVNSFLSFDVEESVAVTNYQGEVNITSLSDSSSGYKWQIKGCNNTGQCSPWKTFDVAPNFMVDTVPPSAPGNLILATTTQTSIILNFGASTTETNFDSYRVHYKSGVSGVSLTDSQWTDTNLLDINYNNVSTTTISGLESYTQYVINIWAFDKAGNYTAASEVVGLTQPAPHARSRSVMFHAGDYSSTDGLSGQLSDTNQTFSSFSFEMAEKDVNIRNAYVLFEAVFAAYGGNYGNWTGYNLAFDACDSPCSPDAFNGTSTVITDDNTVLAFNETENNQVRLLLDVTNELNLEAYDGESAGMEGQVGYRLELGSATSSISQTRATLVITYAYNEDESTNYTNTVIYPLDSTNGSDSGSRTITRGSNCTKSPLGGANCPLFEYNMAIPEIDTQLDQWFQTFIMNDGNGAADVQINVNIEGTNIDSPTMIHESFNGGTQGYSLAQIFDGVSGFSENTDQELEYYHYNSNGYIIGGEVVETYTAPASANTKTRTVVMPMGVLINGQSVDTASQTLDVYFPENGAGSGIVDVKKAWFRIYSNERTDGDDTITVASKVGANATSSNLSYTTNPGGTIVRPSFTIIHIISSGDYSELESANATNPKKVKLITTNGSADYGGVSAELLITYTYTNENNGYLASLDLYGGQSANDGDAKTVSLAPSEGIFSELRGNKTMRSAGLLPSYLLSTNDGAGTMPATYFSLDADIATVTPNCSAAYYMDVDGANAFAEYVVDVTSNILTTDHLSYTACVLNYNASDTNAGGKMNAIWRYTYQWDAPPVEYTQDNWRWYQNVNTTEPVAPMAAENTSVSGINIADILRLRMSIGITKEDLISNTQNFKLQYGLNSDCLSVSDWHDVGGIYDTDAWIGYNNTAPNDGDNITSLKLSSSTVMQSYEESNPSANNPNTVTIGNFAEWDWVVYNYAATSTSNYCFRMVKGDGSAFTDYLTDSYAKLTTAASNTKPVDPSSLAQYRSDGVTVIPNLGWINENTVVLNAQATDPNLGEVIFVYFQAVNNASSTLTATTVPSGACVSGIAFDSCVSKVWYATSSPGDYRSTFFTGSTTIPGLPESSSGYKWQTLACDDGGACSEWVSPGATPNFRVDITPPSAPGNLIFGTSTPTTITLNFGASTTETNFDEYHIYYKVGTSGVTESDNQHADNDLLDQSYGGTATSTVINLSANTEYVFNIWAYDLAGNKASATLEAVGTTTSSYNPPTGSFSPVFPQNQKSDGSGRVDLTIAANDPDNDDTLRARILYVAGATCDFSSPLDPTLDETDANITATYGDPDIDDDSYYQVGTSTAWIMTSPGQNYVQFDWLSKIDEPNANGPYCVKVIVNDGLFDQVATATDVIIVDNIPPTSPGPLATSSVSYNNILLKYGTASVDPRFEEYKIYYKEGAGGASTSDTEHNDSNLDYINYNGATSTLVSGLKSDTWYTFNIWAYDDRGNVSSSTELVVKTNSAPTNILAVQQYRSNGTTTIPNGNWLNESNVILSGAVHDKDIADTITFYYEVIPATSTFTVVNTKPTSSCASGTAYEVCSSKIWAVSTTTSDLPTDWYNRDWLYRKKITINASSVDANISDYALLATTTDSSLAGYARDDGYDIVFTDSGGVATIPFEREYFNGTNGELIAWVKTNISSTTDTEIYMYYGNSNADIDQSATSTVWVANFEAVWHLSESVVDESSSTNAHLDSTSNAYDADQYGNNEKNDHLYRGQEFDGFNDYIDAGNIGSINAVSCWIKSDSGDESLFDFDGGTHTIAISSGQLTAAGWASPIIYVDGVATGTVDTNWHYITVTTATAFNATATHIGRAGLNYFRGELDEVRVSGAERSQGWTTTYSSNQNDVNSFISFGSVSEVTSYYEAALVIQVPDSPNSTAGYKWQVLACDDDNDCSAWDDFNSSVPNFKIDTTSPTTPGVLTESTKTSNSVTLNFGAQTTEKNFSTYRIYYSTSSPILETDSEQIDSNLAYIDYNSAANTTINGLLASTTYYFNIWAYDLVGNKASSTIVSITTKSPLSSPGVFFYTKGDRNVYYRVWTGTAWQAELTGPQLGSGAGDNIIHLKTLRSDDGGKVAILAKTFDGANQEWWGAVYRFAADSFATSTQLGAVSATSTNASSTDGCIASLSGKEFFVVTANGSGDGTQVYSWDSVNNWNSEGAGPNPSAVLNSCELIRRPDTDNYILLTYDDDRDLGAAYYNGGSTFANSWTAWAQHSNVEEDATNHFGDAFFDPQDNTRGAITYSNSGGAFYGYAKYFTANNTTLSFGAAVTSPTAGAWDWNDDYVHGEFAADPGQTGIAYFAGRDIDNELNVYKVDVTNPAITWATTTNGDNISGQQLYEHTNYSQKPFSIIFSQYNKGVVLWNYRSATSAKYNVINGTTDTISATMNIDGSTNDLWTRVRTYKDPEEQEFIAIYQNSDFDYSAVFWNAAGEKFYNTIDNPGSNQIWTELVTGTSAFDRDNDLTSFAYTSYNSAPNAPTNLAQYKTDASTTIANQGWTNEEAVVFEGSVIDADTDEVIKIYVQLLANPDTYNASSSEPTNACASTTLFSDCASKVWQIATSTAGDYSVSPYNFSGSIVATSSTIGYKWQAKACDDDGECGAWKVFNTNLPNYYIDTTPPTPPGSLTITNVTSNSLRLNFGATSTEDNFSEYRIYYKIGAFGAGTGDTQHSDSDLGDILYAGTSFTDVAGLSSSTQYVFNIWAVDLAGNMASATPEVSTTTLAAPKIEQTSYIFENDDGVNVNSNSPAVAADTAVNNINIGERLVARFQIENNGGDVAGNKVYRLEFENQTQNPGNWITVGASTEISYSPGLSGSNGASITTSTAAINTNTWTNGTWHEDTNQTGNITLNKNQYTEIAFMVETSNASTSKTYRLRLFNATDNEALNTYASLANINTAAGDNIRYSKYTGSLPSDISDLSYYYDPSGYSAIAVDDNVRTAATSSSNYPVFLFASHNGNDTDAISVTWNGQSTVAASTRKIYLQVYRYGTPSQWITVASSSTALADTDFTLSGSLNSDLDIYYDGNYWTYWRVYQNSGNQTLKSDYYNTSFSAPVPEVSQIHYRWRNDNGTEATASWREAEDYGDPTAPTVAIDKNQVIRLRIEPVNLGGGDAANYNYGLQYASSTGSCTVGTGPWTAIPNTATAHWRMGTTTNFNDSDSTVNRLSNSESYTYTNGRMVQHTSTTTANITISEEYYTEVEFIVFATQNANTGGTYCFRLTNSGTILDGYDDYPILTLSGSVNDAPAFSVFPVDDSASSSPTNFGSDVTFTATAGDGEGDDYYLAVCKTNSVQAGNDGPPSCLGGEWCISTETASSAEASCAYTSADDTSEIFHWYAFACDKKSGFGVADCSVSSQGQGTADENTPFIVNRPPTFTSVATIVDNLDPGGTYTAWATSSDSDIVGGADTLRLHVCETNAASFAGCTGVTLCSQTSTSSPNASCSFSTTTPAKAGSFTYYTFIYDSHGLAATANSRSSTYTVNNVAPSLGTLSLNNGQPITLNIRGAGDKAISAINTSIIDLNGCTDLQSVIGVIFMNEDDYNCSQDENDCYRLSSIAAECSITCLGSSYTNATSTCTAQMKYFSVPTDNETNNPKEAYKWMAYMQLYDGSNYSAATSSPVELNSVTALDVTEEIIDFGNDLFAGQNSGTDNSTTTIYNSGNTPIDSDIAGTDLVADATSSIAVKNVEWSLAAGFTWSLGTDLTAAGDNVDIVAPRPTTTADIYDKVYWGIGIPPGTNPKPYNGQNTFTVILDNDGW